MQIRTIDLTRGSIMKALLLFAVPLFISNLFQQLYNTADTMIVGNVLGDQSLAAIGSTSAVFELIIGFANGVGSGFGIVIACLWGANDREKLKKAVASSLILSLMLSAVLMIVSFVALKPLLILLKTPADILEEAYGYISIICMAVAITMLYNLGAALLRAIGDSITPADCSADRFGIKYCAGLSVYDPIFHGDCRGCRRYRHRTGRLLYFLLLVYPAPRKGPGAFPQGFFL